MAADYAQWKGKGEPSLPDGGEMLVIVAKNGDDDRPDPATVQAFTVPAGTGINYAQGTWRGFSACAHGLELTRTDHPVLTLDATVDLACIETQIGDGRHTDPKDCELLGWDGPPFARVLVPDL